MQITNIHTQIRTHFKTMHAIVNNQQFRIIKSWNGWSHCRRPEYLLRRPYIRNVDGFSRPPTRKPGFPRRHHYTSKHTHTHANKSHSHNPKTNIYVKCLPNFPPKHTYTHTIYIASLTDTHLTVRRQSHSFISCLHFPPTPQSYFYFSQSLRHWDQNNSIQNELYIYFCQS